MILNAHVNGLPYLILVVSLLLFPLINISLASTPSELINPFIGSEDLWSAMA